jgi:hypothetical protein
VKRGDKLRVEIIGDSASFVSAFTSLAQSALSAFDEETIARDARREQAAHEEQLKIEKERLAE